MAESRASELTIIGLDGLRSETISLDGRLAAGPVLVEDCLVIDDADGAARFAMVEAEDYRACIPLLDLFGTGTVQSTPDGLPRVVVGGGRSRCWNVKNAHTIRLLADPEPDTVPVVTEH